MMHEMGTVRVQGACWTGVPAGNKLACSSSISGAQIPLANDGLLLITNNQ